MTKPYSPSSLNPVASVAIDATFSNIFTWKFLDPTTGHIQSAYWVEWRETASISTTLSGATIIGATIIPVVDGSKFQINYTITIGSGGTQETKVITAVSGNNLTVSALAYVHSSGETVALIATNTGWVTSATTSYTLPANTLINGKSMSWRIKYKDSNSTPIESDFSDWCLFKTSTKPTCSITYPILDNDIVTNEIPSFTHSFGDAEGKPQLNYQYKAYADDGITLIWTSDLKTDYNNLIVPPKGLLKNSTYYKVSVTVTDADGLSTTSSIRRFFTNYPSSVNSSDYFTAIPDNTNAHIDLKWATIKHIMGNYVGSGIRYKPAKFSNGVEISQLGEKLYWNINIPDIFTLKGLYTPNSTTIGDIVFLYKDDSNYLRFNYDEVTNKFYVEKNVNGSIRTYGSPATIVTVGQSFFYAIKQNLTGLYIWTGVGATLNKWGDI